MTVRELTIQVKSAVNEAFEEKSVENGQLTGERLKAMLSDYQETLLSVIDERITDLPKISTIRVQSVLYLQVVRSDASKKRRVN